MNGSLYYETFTLVLDRLDAQGIAHMVVGSVASMVYGEPRLTHDIDLVVELQPPDASALWRLFPLSEFYCPPVEVIQSEIVHRGQFNLIHHESGLKVDIMIRKESPHARSEFARRRRVPFFEGRSAWLASAEDVIIKKLDFHRMGGSEKHIHDIRGILAETSIDDAYLQHWIAALRLQDSWAVVRGMA